MEQACIDGASVPATRHDVSCNSDRQLTDESVVPAFHVAYTDAFHLHRFLIILSYSLGHKSVFLCIGAMLLMYTCRSATNFCTGFLARDSIWYSIMLSML